MSALSRVSSKKRAKASQWFFKTGPGEYGEGDVFIGVTMPNQRAVIKDFTQLPFTEIALLLKSEIHEHRMSGLLILIEQFNRGDSVVKEKVVQFYLKHIDRINNWDLIDCSAPRILGEYCRVENKDALLKKLLRSKVMWHRRIAMVSTWSYIRFGSPDIAFQFAEQLLNNSEDLMHKVTGWMLREAGKKDKKTLVAFLTRHSANIPRTMLRYAIERFPETERKNG